MTYKEIDDLVAGMGFPYAYYQFPEGEAQPTPFICFYYEGSDDLMADNINYQAIRPLTIELYTDNKDFVAEALVESSLIAEGLTFTRTETYIGSQRMYLTTYDTEVVING